MVYGECGLRLPFFMFLRRRYFTELFQVMGQCFTRCFSEEFTKFVVKQMAFELESLIWCLQVAYQFWRDELKAIHQRRGQPRVCGLMECKGRRC